ncbi:MAG: bifunctional phosphopantothenoylcysteine decarboxylase/phosphopantothenate--cysteine ligase CoaBC [Gammaproteobacteria bacterium]|nr:bifunctional phosphopantothenoylcysteine decarboxylase/phosphopantothenate--cysteine ligase CoaBC [Gammaproteobacteria bacterium]MDH5344776.1 bifunctional phosphopantothenoylcysteine decarboxylase/phosphopantothenate--cysteine ligase CoaBC [Gammaproteobacteria bacterium]
MPALKVILGVTGGIAAYKTPELVRRLKARGADVQVVLTRSAREFVTSTTLQAVSGRPVRDNLWDESAEAAMGHIELARWADLVLIAPATAEFMSRLAAGAAPDLLSTLCLATEAPVVIAPAMNHVMWANPAVQQNRRVLEARGVRLLGPAVGDQACGETGPGRMVEPDDIVAAILAPSAVPVASPVAGKTVMITAGPTREAIDPVRYLTNRSSGRMGYALAAAARDAGARVILVSGPVSIVPPEGVEVLNVENAVDMYEAVLGRIDGADIFIGAAAVADYRAADVRPDKIKKSADEIAISLVRNPDILASVAALGNRPFTVGFAAETARLREYALLKLEKKNLDMIVANLVGRDRGFETDRNAVDVYWKGGERSFPESEKRKLADGIIALVGERYAASRHEDTRPELPALASRD